AAPKKVARRVLGEASLSQIETVFDNASLGSKYVITQQGLGKNVLNLTPNDCVNGNLKTVASSTSSICRSTQDYGYQYKYTNQRQGSFFELLTSYHLAPRTFSLRWRFYENGIIEPALGISGQLPQANSTTPENFTDHVAWRLDFDLGGSGANDQILEVTSTPIEDRLQKTVAMINIMKELGRTQDPEIKRLWMVRDGTTPYESVSVPAYDIVPNNYDYSRLNTLNEAWLKQEIYFTKYNACERFAANNLLNNCPKINDNVARFSSNKEVINGADSVVWYRQSTHHIVRSDDNLRLGTIWSSFQLVPRDWHSQNQF
ncbi:MAG TPA: hypothetical protein PLM98_07195, partial [Thiolinea sp.]|nr:hypothetical protein [Thiolinea sp.]